MLNPLRLIKNAASGVARTLETADPKSARELPATAAVVQAKPGNAVWSGNPRSPATVKEIQRRLNADGAQLQEDGSFGTETRDAVVAFQRRHGLKPDGRVGEDTLAMMQQPSNAEKLQNLQQKAAPVIAQQVDRFDRATRESLHARSPAILGHTPYSHQSAVVMQETEAYLNGDGKYTASYIARAVAKLPKAEREKYRQMIEVRAGQVDFNTKIAKTERWASLSDAFYHMKPGDSDIAKSISKGYAKSWERNLQKRNSTETDPGRRFNRIEVTYFPGIRDGAGIQLAADVAGTFARKQKTAGHTGNPKVLSSTDYYAAALTLSSQIQSSASHLKENTVRNLAGIQTDQKLYEEMMSGMPLFRASLPQSDRATALYQTSLPHIRDFNRDSARLIFAASAMTKLANQFDRDEPRSNELNKSASEILSRLPLYTAFPTGKSALAQCLLENKTTDTNPPILQAMGKLDDSQRADAFQAITETIPYFAGKTKESRRYARKIFLTAAKNLASDKGVGVLNNFNLAIQRHNDDEISRSIGRIQQDFDEVDSQNIGMLLFGQTSTLAGTISEQVSSSLRSKHSQFFAGVDKCANVATAVTALTTLADGKLTAADIYDPMKAAKSITELLGGTGSVLKYAKNITRAGGIIGSVDSFFGAVKRNDKLAAVSSGLSFVSLLKVFGTRANAIMFGISCAIDIAQAVKKHYDNKAYARDFKKTYMKNLGFTERTGNILLRDGDAAYLVAVDLHRADPSKTTTEYLESISHTGLEAAYNKLGYPEEYTDAFLQYPEAFVCLHEMLKSHPGRTMSYYLDRINLKLILQSSSYDPRGTTAERMDFLSGLNHEFENTEPFPRSPQPH